MNTKTLLSLATVSLLAFVAKADGETTYSVDERTVWFDENIASAGETLNPEDGTYSATPTYAVEGDKDNRYISLDTAANSPLFFTPTTGTLPTGAKTYLFEVTIKSLTLCASTPTVSDSPYASIAAVAGTPNKWYGWNGSAWEALTGIDAPVEGDPYNVAIEFFVETLQDETSQLKIKYIVGTQSATVTASGDELPELTKVGFAGYGQFQNFSGSGVKSTLSVTTTKTKEDLVAAGLVVAAGQTVAQALNSEGQNGLPQWQSLALGIDPRTTTKPYTAPVQTDNGDLGFTIGNYGTPSVDGNVTFDVYEYDIGNQTLGTKVTKTSVAAGSTAEVTAPTANAGVKYYKIKITFANP